MNFWNNFKNVPRKAGGINNLLIKTLIVSALIITGIQTTAQTQYARPSWFFGVAGAANINFYDAKVTALNSEFISPVTFQDGRGVGTYAGLVAQYRPDRSILGFMVQLGYDSRSGKFDRQGTSDLSTNLSYASFEPSLLLAPFRNGFYVYLGPRLAYTTQKSFTYKNPPGADVRGDFDNVRNTRISGQVGMGYDIMLGASTSPTKFVISPFVAWHPHFGQNPRSVESWDLTTLRAGLALKVGTGRAITPATPPPPPVPVVTDRDGDGVADAVDRCPDVKGLASLQGCPDRDGDGITDAEDKCPDVAGLARYQGCPVPDTDGDGINDEADKCPAVAGVARYQGCPIPDTDGDGVNDEEDKCINEKGPASNFGCPVISEELMKRIKIAAQNVFFTTGKATLLAKSYPKLNDVVAILNENVNYKLQISGHTDIVGDDAANQTLSEERAAAVRTYLVSKGIAESRISSAGYGETKPIADNNTTAGKAKNRRVEMVLSNY
jgi:outer membrane protein OmpA-like peptidoglycan-associated protein